MTIMRRTRPTDASGRITFKLSGLVTETIHKVHFNIQSQKAGNKILQNPCRVVISLASSRLASRTGLDWLLEVKADAAMSLGMRFEITLGIS